MSTSSRRLEALSINGWALFFIIFGTIIFSCIFFAPRLREWCQEAMRAQDRMIEAERRKDRLARIHPDKGLEKGPEQGDGASKPKVKPDKVAASADDTQKAVLMVGDPVQACRASASHNQDVFDQTNSFPASISRDNGDNTYAVTYVGGETHPAVPRRFIVKASEAYTFS